MYTTQPQEYDVVIMGAGFAGVCQARHLMLNIPNIKVALIDPRPEERTDKDMKIGESMIEGAALFVCKELGLYEYMIENHTPKNGLNFHWPKDPAQTSNLDDYYHLWVNRQTDIGSFHMNRAKFERDVLKMNKEMGAVFYNCRVLDVDLTPGDAIKTVKVKVHGEDIEVKAKHVIDAAGRKFIIGRKTNNVIFHQPDGGQGPDNLYGLNNGSAWVRVRNIDRKLFHDGYDPTGAATSHYYATNHWFGHGHWLWMIPTDKDPLELSIGVIHHHEVIPANSINSLDKFSAFLKENHKLLYQLINSGELVDFHYLPRLGHNSKTLYSEDNWYVLGDAACIFDAFYSFGTTMIAFASESITEIIRAKLAKEADAETKREAYNRFNLRYVQDVNRLYRYHAKQLGNASIMSWRISFEYTWWFGLHVPLYLGKWHLHLRYVNTYLQHTKRVGNFINHVHDQLSLLGEQGKNIGFLDPYRADQLLNHHSPVSHADTYLENARYEPRRCNIFRNSRQTCLNVAVWYAMFLWKGFGIAGFLSPRSLQYLFLLIGLVGYGAFYEIFYLYQTRKLPANSQVAQRNRDVQDYQYRAKLQPWIAEAQ
ncbi:MAG: tryptophan halogenase [Nodularia sp. CChRGM 3473]